MDRHARRHAEHGVNGVVYSGCMWVHIRSGPFPPTSQRPFLFSMYGVQHFVNVHGQFWLFDVKGGVVGVSQFGSQGGSVCM